MLLPRVGLFCKNVEETIDHLFLHVLVRRGFGIWLSCISCWLTPHPEGISELMQQIWTPPFYSLGISLWRIVVVVSLWHLWKEKFEDVQGSHQRSLFPCLFY
ncbi:hypothetical protein AMTRI_Chr10g227520 [Amborella trichopoda]